ncbi:MAG: DedA family protein [Myxococcales bacterium]|nr:DedA family protein [Myxococcales bacterium]
MSSGVAAPVPWYRYPQRLLRRLYDWTVAWAERPGGAIALFVLAFVESSFFPIPPDVLLIALCVGKPKGALKFATICSVGSVLGGCFGYYIGWGLWEALRGVFIPHVFSQAAFDQVVELYRDNAFLTVFTAAFTPIPYKVITIAAGVCRIPFSTLVAGSAIGRSLRFFLVAGALWLFGAKVKRLIEKHFDWLSVVFTVLLVGGFVAIKMLR